MATQNLVEQVIVFISSTGDIDQNAILSNSLVKQLIDNSTGKKVEFGYKSYVDDTSGTLVYSTLFELRCYVTTAFQTTIQTNIPNLQSSFPQYTIATWGGNVVFGN